MAAESQIDMNVNCAVESQYWQTDTNIGGLEVGLCSSAMVVYRVINLKRVGLVRCTYPCIHELKLKYDSSTCNMKGSWKERQCLHFVKR